MKRSLIAFCLVALAAGPALAATGDPRVVEGTLEWPASLSVEPFVLVRGGDGQTYYVDLSAAQRRSPAAISAGSRVAILGVEGNRPHEIAAFAFGAGDATALGLTAPIAVATPSVPIPSIVIAPASGSEPLWRLAGTVESVSGMMVALRAEDGKMYTVDASELSEATVKGLQRGEPATLYGVPRQDRRLVANGYIQMDASPAASPPSPR